MPSNKIHCAISKKRTGHTFEELHQWIDKPSEESGVDHRRERHNYDKKDEEYIRNYWEKKEGLGDKAVVEWLFHIALDNLCTSFKESHKIYKNNTYNFYTIGLHESGYINLDFHHFPDDELNKKFDKDSFRDYFEEEK
jgi:hypothetical protein